MLLPRNSDIDMVIKVNSYQFVLGKKNPDTEFHFVAAGNHHKFGGLKCHK